MTNNDLDSEGRTDLLAVRAAQSIGPGMWVGACFSLGGIAGIIWQAYVSAPTIPPTALGFIWVLAAMSIISLLGAGRELYIREGLRIASEYSRHVAVGRSSITETSTDRASSTAQDERATQHPPTADAEAKPVVVASYEIHEAVSANDPDEEPFDLEYLAFHNIGPEAAFNIRIDPILVAEDTVTLFGPPVKLLKRDDTAERQVRGGLSKRIGDAQHGSAVGTRLPLNVRYEDRGGKEWEILHVIEVTKNGIEIGPVGERQIYWTKLL